MPAAYSCQSRSSPAQWLFDLRGHRFPFPMLRCLPRGRQHRITRKCGAFQTAGKGGGFLGGGNKPHRP
jgi:hypothetical protein